jgi:hypothetical protein
VLEKHEEEEEHVGRGMGKKPWNGDEDGSAY